MCKILNVQIAEGDVMKGQEFLTEADLRIIIVAIVIGTLARLFTLKEDYRQYPT